MDKETREAIGRETFESIRLNEINAVWAETGKELLLKLQAVCACHGIK